MKDSFYFQHDYNAANDQRILKLRAKFDNAKGYGMYFMILEAMAQEESGTLEPDCIAQLSLSYSLAIEELKAVLEYCISIGLFVSDEKGIYSHRMLEHKNFRKERSSAGKRGAKNRWKNGSAIKEPLAQPMQRKGKERKEKDIIKESTNVDGVPPTYGNEDINKTLEAIRLKVGIDDFSDAQKWKRIYGQHCLNLLKKIGSQEFSRRLDIILNDSFKRKRCNEIKYIYEQVKGFIEPTISSKIAKA